MNKIKKIIVFVLIFAMCITVVNTQSAYAASASGTDVARVANAEPAGSTWEKYCTWYYGRQHREAWCAIFTSWCADQAGVPTNVIPRTAGVSMIYAGVINGGGKVVTSPQAGDLVFYKIHYANGDSWGHVGIMVDSKNSVQGNLCSQVMHVKPTDYKCNSEYTICYVRPNYGTKTGDDDGNSNSNDTTGNISATVTTGSTDSVTEAGTVLRGSFSTSGVRATECGMYIGTSSEVKNMTKLGSDSVNTYGTNMYYSTSKYGYKLTAGTIYYYRAYAIVNGTTYWGDAKSFFVPISIGIGITDVDTTEEEKSGASGSNTSGFQALQSGSTGDDVKTMQTMLNSVTFAGLSVDGNFGASTLKALKNYQTQKGLTVDGVCGAKTWSALESDYKKGKKYCTHSSYKFLFAEAAHPHYNYYQCNTCGEKFTDKTTAKMDSCTTCNPVKAVVTTKGADNITQTSAIVRGEVTVSSGKLTECGMFIGKTPDSLAFLGRDYISKGTPFYYSTTKFGYPLTAGTTYYYRAYAFVDGKAIWGDMKSFTTLKATATQTATVVGTSGEYLAINNGPASSSAGKSTQIGRIPPGGVVTVDMSKKSGNWYWVTYNGVSGYAYSGYLSLN